MNRKFDLNVEKILDNWEIYHAIREIIANALDEMVLTNSKMIETFKDKQGWHIKDYGRGLKYISLTQNENIEKKNCDKVIGKFGVGLKDALAVLYKNNVEVDIYSKYNHISLEMCDKANFSNIKTLHAVINEPVNNNMIGTDFVINVCDEDIAKAKSLFLLFNKNELLDVLDVGEIYKKTSSVSSIYVHGVKVAEEDNYLFDYNITKVNKVLDKALNRERTSVGRTAYSLIIKQMLLKSKNDNVIELLINELKKIPLGTNSDEVSLTDIQVHATKEYNATHKIVMVSADEAMDYNNNDKEKIEEAGREVLIIPGNAYQKLDGGKDYTGKDIGTFQTVINEYNESFVYEFVNISNLSTNEKRVFELKDFVLDIYPIRDKSIKIKISKNINEMISGDVLGVWDKSENAVIIKKEILKEPYKFCEVLFHEIAHANTGYEDNTRDFENILGEIIRKLSKIILKDNFN